jgi:hypothetical protein
VTITDPLLSRAVPAFDPLGVWRRRTDADGCCGGCGVAVANGGGPIAGCLLLTAEPTS